MKKYFSLILFFVVIACSTNHHEADPQLIKIYQGTTTIPPMGFYEDIVTTGAEVPKLVHTARFTTESPKFGAHNITKYSTGEHLLNAVKENVSKYPNAKFEIHTQVFLKCFPLNQLLKSIPKERISSLHLYDDGADNYIQLYEMKQKYTAEKLHNIYQS